MPEISIRERRKVHRRASLIVVVILCVLSTAAAAQEHSYSPADIEAGRGLYAGSCAGCHGPGGDQVNGAELHTGRFRRATSDQELIDIIRNGIPGTAMPPHTHSDVALQQIVAFLRSLPTASTDDGPVNVVRVGDPVRGRTLFEGRGECLSCHSVAGRGSRVGPALDGLGGQRSPGEFLESLTDPNADVRAGNRFYRAVTSAGTTITGRLLNQDTHTVQLIDTAEQLVSLEKASLREHGFTGSPMPSYENELDAGELSDLVGFLMSLR